MIPSIDPLHEPLSSIDAASIGASLMRPERRSMVDVLRCVSGASADEVRDALDAARPEARRPPLDRLLDLRGHTDPAEAWEALATQGFIPMSWVANPRRQFVDEKGRVSRSPRSLDQCVIFASDVMGITAAEELAHEVVARLSPWFRTAPDTMTWTDISRLNGDRLSRRPSLNDLQRPSLLDLKRQTTPQGNELLSRLTVELRGAISVPVRKVVGTGWKATPDERAYYAGVNAMTEVQEHASVHPSFARQAGEDALCHHLFDFLSKASRKSTAGFSFRTIRDPFLPLLGLWGRGYMLHEILDTSIVLAAPRFGWVPPPTAST